MNPLAYLKLAGVAALVAAVGFLAWNYTHMQHELAVETAEVATLQAVNKHNEAALAELHAYQTKVAQADKALEAARLDFKNLRQEIAHAPKSNVCIGSPGARALLRGLHQREPAAGGAQGGEGDSTGAVPVVPAGPKHP